MSITKEYARKAAVGYGLRVKEVSGHFFIDMKEYRIYLVNVQERSVSQRNVINPKIPNMKEHRFEWVIKRNNSDLAGNKEVYRVPRYCLTEELFEIMRADIASLIDVIKSDSGRQKANFPNEFFDIAKRSGLDIRSTKVQKALMEAYILGQNSKR